MWLDQRYILDSFTEIVSFGAWVICFHGYISRVGVHAPIKNEIPNFLVGPSFAELMSGHQTGVILLGDVDYIESAQQ